MGKKSRSRGVAVAERPPAGADVPVVGGREPCPCGSGKRYKLCHGRTARDAAVRLVARPFEGLPGECDWVALREIVPSATAVVGVAEEFGGGEVTVVTVLPMAWPALHRADGSVFVATQTSGGSGDPSRDVAAALLAAREIEPGNPVTDVGLPEAGPRLQDVLAAKDFPVRVHEGFDFWLEGVGEVSAEVRESMERANGAVVPTERLTTVDAAYWCRVGDRRHLRWVMPEPEDALLDGLARLHAAGSSGLTDGTRYVGSFRAHGLLVPVWDLADGMEADDVEEPAREFAERLREALAVTAPLTAEERRAKSGVVSRQLTLR
jgi:hypothetical protein